MSAGTFNLIIEQGATFHQVFTWKDSDGNLVPLTGYIAKAQIREDYGDAILLEFSTDDDTIVLGDTDGTITLHQEHDIMQELDFRTAKWDLFLEREIDEFTQPLLRGRVTLKKAVTVLV